jgi:hypothetical protein
MPPQALRSSAGDFTHLTTRMKRVLHESSYLGCYAWTTQWGLNGNLGYFGIFGRVNLSWLKFFMLLLAGIAYDFTLPLCISLKMKSPTIIVLQAIQWYNNFEKLTR